MVDDGIATAVEVEVERLGMDGLAIGVTLFRADGPARDRYDFVWSAS